MTARLPQRFPVGRPLARSSVIGIAESILVTLSPLRPECLGCFSVHQLIRGHYKRLVDISCHHIQTVGPHVDLLEQDRQPTLAVTQLRQAAKGGFFWSVQTGCAAMSRLRWCRCSGEDGAREPEFPLWLRVLGGSGFCREDEGIALWRGGGTVSLDLDLDLDSDVLARPAWWLCLRVCHADQRARGPVNNSAVNDTPATTTKKMKRPCIKPCSGCLAVCATSAASVALAAATPANHAATLPPQSVTVSDYWHNRMRQLSRDCKVI